MLRIVPWNGWLLIGILCASVAVCPARSQQPATTPAPAPVPSGSDAPSYVKFGMDNGAKGDLNAAIGAFDQAIKIDPHYAPAYANRAKALAFQHKLTEAIADCDLAIQNDPKYLDAYYQRGTLKGQTGDFDGAVADFTSVIGINPQYAPAYYNLGHVKYFKNDPDGAVANLDQALKLAPNFPYSYFIRGLILHAKGDKETALADFQKSSGFGFPYGAIWSWIVKTENGERGLARKDLEDAINSPEIFKPGDWAMEIGNLMLEKTTPDQFVAKAQALTGTEAKEQVCEAWFYAGQYKRLAGDPKGALDCFLKAIATGAKSSEELMEAKREATELQTQ